MRKHRTHWSWQSLPALVCHAKKIMRDWIKDCSNGKLVLKLHLGGEEYAEIETYKDKYILYSANDTSRVEEDTFETITEAKKEAEGWT